MAVLFLILILSLLMYQGAKITGLLFLGQRVENLSFSPPTPPNGSVMNLPWVIINVSSPEKIILAVLSWQGQNLSMELGTEEGSPYAWVRVNDSGTIQFVAYALNQNGSSSSTETRTIQLTYLNWTHIPNQLMLEDGRLDLDLWQRIESVKNGSQIGFSIQQDRTDSLFCGLDQAHVLNCNGVLDATGKTAVSVTADDGVGQASTSFNVTIVAVNDPPRFLGPIQGRSMRPKDEWDLDIQPFFIDVDSEALTFSVIGAQRIPFMWLSPAKVRFAPNESSIGWYNLSIIANDSENSTSSNTFVLAVRPNLAPVVITRLVALILNNTRAYSLKFHQIFEDPDDDELTFSSGNLSIARIIRRSNTLFIVPLENKTGTETLKLSASDGQSTTTFGLPIVLVSAEESSSHPPSVSPNSPAPSPVGSSGIPASQEQEYQTQVQKEAVGLTYNKSLEQAASPQDMQQAAEGSTPISRNSSFPPPNLKGPVLVKPLPSIVFDENTTNVTLHLEEYWHDATGKGMEFLIEQKSPFVTKLQSKNIAVISLASPIKQTANETVKIIAKDGEGNIVTGKVLVTLSSAVARHQDKIDIFLMAAISITIIILGALVYIRFRLGFNQGEHSSQVLPPRPRQSFPSQEQVVSLWKNRPGTALSLLQDSWADLVSVFNPNRRLDEPSELKSAAMLLREAHAILKVIISSTEDELVSAALKREEEKLSRAMALMRHRSGVDVNDMRRILLYIKEASVCLYKIIEVADESVINRELHKEAERLENIAKLIEVKMVYNKEGL